LELPFDVPLDDRFELLLEFARGPAFGWYEVALDGEFLSAIGGRDDEPATKQANVRIEGYSPEFISPREQVLVWAKLAKGEHRLTFRCVGKVAAAERFDLGLQALIVSRVGNVPAETAEAQRLREIGLQRSRSLAELQRGLSHADAEVRAAAAWALGQLGPAGVDAAADLVHGLSDPDPIVRGLAAVALREAGVAASSAAPALIASLKDTDSSVRMVCAEALGRIKAIAAVPALIALSQNPAEHLHVLRNVIAALGEMGPGAKSALPALVALKANPRLRYPATAAQSKIAGAR
jgi:HEAT repeat protein